MCPINEKNLSFLMLVNHVQSEWIWVNCKSTKAQYPHRYKLLWGSDNCGSAFTFITVVIRKMQIKTVRSYYISSGMAKMQRTERTKCPQLCGLAFSSASEWRLVQPRWTLAPSSKPEQVCLWASISSFRKAPTETRTSINLKTCTRMFTQHYCMNPKLKFSPNNRMHI